MVEARTARDWKSSARLLSCFLLGFRLSCCAFTLGLQFVVRIVASTRCFVALRKLPVRLTTLDTVAVETPARFATSLMVVIGRIGLRVFIGQRTLGGSASIGSLEITTPLHSVNEKNEFAFVDAVNDEEVKVPYWQSSVVFTRIGSNSQVKLSEV